MSVGIGEQSQNGFVTILVATVSERACSATTADEPVFTEAALAAEFIRVPEIDEHSRLVPDRRDLLMPVGSLEAGKSPYGIDHLAGNAWEWNADWSDADDSKTSPAQNPTGPARGESRVVQGGSWTNMLCDLRPTNRNYFGPASTFFGLGFRCAQDHGR